MSFIKRKIHLIAPIVLTVLTVVGASAQSQPQPGTASPSPQASPAASGVQTSPSSPATQPATQQPTAAPSSSPAAQASPSPNAQTGANQTANASSGTVIPAGTLITITPTQPIQNAQVGATYPAQISQNVTGSDGKVLIPSGTSAQLTVNNAVNPSGAQEMALALKSITLNGRTLNVSTNQGQSGAQSGATSSQPANAASQGGLLGTPVQALGANGNQQQGNAAQSGGSGVLSSVLGQILTRGSTLNVPSQSQLTFRLEQPLQLQ